MAAAIEDLLVQQGAITPEQKAEVQQYADRSNVGFVRAVVETGLLTDSQVMEAVATNFQMEYVPLERVPVAEDVQDLLDLDDIRKFEAVPVRFNDSGNGVIVAIANPRLRNSGPQIAEAMNMGPEAVELVMTTKRELGAVLKQLVAANGSAGKQASAGRVLSLADEGPQAAKNVTDSVTQLGDSGPPLIDLDDLLEQLLERGGSDLHVTAGLPPAIRISGDLIPLDEFPRMMPDEIERMVYSIMTQKQRESFENNLELDMSYSMPGKSRFRVNVFRQRDSIGTVMRVIPFEILPLEKLGIPEQVSNFAYLPRGFVLVTGPTGSGKSTTLASLIDLINRNRPVHIMTVEDPIEFLHQHKRAVVNQREVGTDTHGFAVALKHVLRQDPDVILVGELRDLETIQIALTAAETGHLVFGTLHTQDAPQTIDRIVDVFPPHQQEQIRVMLAGALKGVVCQTLIKDAHGGRVAACEVMVANSGIKNLIREGKTHQVYSAIQAGAKDGMVSMDQSLATLVKSGRISYEAALEKCNSPQEFKRLAGRS